MLKEIKGNDMINDCYENQGVFVENIDKDAKVLGSLLDGNKNYRLSGTIYNLYKDISIDEYNYNIDMHLDLKNEKLIKVNDGRDNFRYINLFNNYDEAKKYTIEWLEDAYRFIELLEAGQVDHSIMTKYYDYEVGYNKIS